MGYNKETHKKFTTIIDNDIAKTVMDLAKANKRSDSKQLAYMVESYIKENEQNELDTSNNKRKRNK